MDDTAVEAALAAAERALGAGESLRGTGFWAAVEAVKGSPRQVERFADRIAAIDRGAFEGWPLILVGEPAGTVTALIGAALGVVAVVAAASLESLWDLLCFAAGLVALLGTTHGLAHLAVGRVLGMRFTHWFVGSLTRPQPGVKVDYASYLRTPARQRARMHASGAVATKLVPVVLIPAAVSAGLAGWVPWALLAATAVAIVADIVWSTKSSDWKKYRREMGHAGRVR